MAKEQKALAEVKVHGKRVATLFSAAQNLGVAGLHIGPLYVDFNPTTRMVFVNARFFKAWIYPGLRGGFKLETAAHYLKFFPTEGVVRYR